MEINLTVGMLGEKSEPVTSHNTAIQYGSGSVAVYATPAMVGLMEGACVNTVDAHLPEGMSTVGIDLKIKHTAATPVGMTVRAEATLTGINGKRLTFAIKAFDDKEQIGEGSHERYIINVEKFLQKAGAKKN
ncbi:thioesterase family protein [Propionispora hippei]|uniref:Thioesterase superfamily n=1 Tax=Propionispora hippei DSM 15287 TaxID=1123003 RepID=A0A1M6D003_9FIRM|nr:thioesterase family protein [Propionispora hippei]SHI66587.1 Thioesterase superfamily [Propionispora hippei DSM 15287]